MDSVASAHNVAAPAKISPIKADPATTEIGELIHAEHGRILRLFRALDDVARLGEPAVAPSALSQIWVRLADLLELHVSAEEEICFPVLFRRSARMLALMETAIAGHHDIREAVAEARLHDVGSAPWWRAITTARTACTEHFAIEEQKLLAEICGLLPPETSKVIARQWDAFTAAQAK